MSLIAEVHEDLRAGRIEDATRKLEAHLQQAPDDVPALVHLAKAHAKAGNWRAAEIAARRLTQLQPDDARHWCGLGIALRKQGKFDEADAAQARALEKRPAWAEPHNELSRIKQARRDARCGAPTRAGRPCRHPAGFGTDHPGQGHCYHHEVRAGGETRGPQHRGKDEIKCSLSERGEERRVFHYERRPRGDVPAWIAAIAGPLLSLLQLSACASLLCLGIAGCQGLSYEGALREWERQKAQVEEDIRILDLGLTPGGPTTPQERALWRSKVGRKRPIEPFPLSLVEDHWPLFVGVLVVFGLVYALLGEERLCALLPPPLRPERAPPSEERRKASRTH